MTLSAPNRNYKEEDDMAIFQVSRVSVFLDPFLVQVVSTVYNNRTVVHINFCGFPAINIIIEKFNKFLQVLIELNVVYVLSISVHV